MKEITLQNCFEYKQYILEEARKKEACLSQYNIAVEANTEAEFQQVVCDNFAWLVEYGITKCPRSITIPNSVTYIGLWAFNDCSSLMSIIIPNSVKSIGDYAFYACSSLTSIVIPNSVKSIGKGAFKDCINLTSIVIPDSVTSIEDFAFKKCTNLRSITIPNSVTSIGCRAFYGCINLKITNNSKCEI